MSKTRLIEALLETHGRTFAEEAGIALGDRPAALFQLIVLALLCGAPVRPFLAVSAARGVFAEGWTSPDKVARATTARRTKVLREAGYARFVERAAVSLGETAKLIARDYAGDLRKLRADCGGDVTLLRKTLRSLPGIGDTAVDVFFAEVQGEWDEVAPFAGARALEAADQLGLGKTPDSLSKLVLDAELPVFVAALTRCSLERDSAELRAAARR